GRLDRTEWLSRPPLGHKRLRLRPPPGTLRRRPRTILVVASAACGVAQDAIGLLHLLKWTSLHTRPVRMQFQCPPTKSRPDVFPACVLRDAQHQVIVILLAQLVYSLIPQNRRSTV